MYIYLAQKKIGSIYFFIDYEENVSMEQMAEIKNINSINFFSQLL